MTDELEKIVDALVPIIKTMSDLTAYIYEEEVSVWEDDDVNIEDAVITKQTREVEYRISTVEIVRALLDRVHDDADKAGLTQMDIDNEDAEKMCVSEVLTALDDAFPDLKAYRLEHPEDADDITYGNS